jgi:glycosyltransferase involved in cell wall biosynthesis
MEIHQVLPALDVYDAVSNDAIEIKNVLESFGYDSKIYSLYVSPKLENIRKPLHELNSGLGKDAILIYHYSIKSEVSGILRQFPNRKILVYHNITPADYFKDYDKDLYLLCRDSKKALVDMKDDYQLALGDSEFNRRELEESGFKNTGVLPILLDLDKYMLFDKGFYQRLAAGGTVNIIFVGRLAPNKKQEDVIKAFYYYHKYINQNSILYIIGKEQVPKYVRQLRNAVDNLGLKDCIVFTGSVGEKTLASYYKAANLFLCMSEHEGFCVPLLEAMSFDVPLLAYSSTGVPFTMGDSGILFKRKDYIQIAEMMNLLISDQELKQKVIQKQRARLQEFNKKSVSSNLIEAIKKVNGV